jgi:O-antigen ligase
MSATPDQSREVESGFGRSSRELPTVPVAREGASPYPRPMLASARLKRVAEAATALPGGLCCVRWPGPAVFVVAVSILWFLPSIALLGPAIIVRRLFADVRVFGPIRPTDVLLAVFVARWAVRRLAASDRESRRSWNMALLLFLAWSWLSLWQTGSMDTLTALARVTLYGGAFLAAADDERLLKPLLVTFALYGTFEVVLAALGVTPHVGLRWYGAKNDPQEFALLLLVALPAALVLPHRLRWPVMGAAVVGIVFTLSRGVWFAAGVELLALTLPWVRRRWFLAFIAGALIILGGLLIQQRVTEQLNLNPDSLALRQQSFQEAVSLIEENPVFGTGWSIGTVRQRDPGAVAPYNLWLNLGASTGILGVCLFALFIALLARELVHDRRPEVVAVWIYLLAFLAVSLEEMPIYADSPATVEFFLLMGAVSAHLAVRARHAAREVERPVVALQ